MYPLGRIAAALGKPALHPGLLVGYKDPPLGSLPPASHGTYAGNGITSGSGTVDIRCGCSRILTGASFATTHFAALAISNTDLSLEMVNKRVIIYLVVVG